MKEKYEISLCEYCYSDRCNARAVRRRDPTFDTMEEEKSYKRADYIENSTARGEAKVKASAAGSFIVLYQLVFTTLFFIICN